MHVIKRNGKSEPVSFDKITERLHNLADGLTVDCGVVAKETIARMSDGIRTSELDIIAANAAEQLKLDNPDYTKFAARILLSNMYKTTPDTFSACMLEIARIVPGRLTNQFVKYVAENAAVLDKMIDHDYDELFVYFGASILERVYLMTVRKSAADADTICDRPQYLYLRVAITMYMGDLQNIYKYYILMASHAYTHATPTLFGAGTAQQLSSCFLLGVDDDITPIMSAAKHMSLMSKSGGGIGYCVDKIRATGSYIKTTGGKASGIVPQLKIVESIARCWNQGGKRLGSIAVYMSLWHGDIMKFLQLKLAQGAETQRARDLYYGIWVPDLFMKRLEAGKDWALFSPHTAPYLDEVYDGMEVCQCGWSPCPGYRMLSAGSTASPATSPTNQDHVHQYERRDVFTELYEKYEREGRALEVLSTKKVASAIYAAQRESGTPYVCHKDHVNRQSGQGGIGTIHTSNLCTEIMEVCDGNSYAVCTLASISLPHYITVPNEAEWRAGAEPVFDYQKLYKNTKSIVKCLARILESNAYPVKQCIANTANYRPIGIGIQGLADIFAIMRRPFVSPEAERVDYAIMETIYYAALTASCRLAQSTGKRFVGYDDCPIARGKLRPDLWEDNAPYRTTNLGSVPYSGMWDWTKLRANIAEHGLYHSLHVALMPTVSTSQILGNNESFEPFPANIYAKSTVVGKYVVANLHMITHLCQLGLWNEQMRVHVTNTGSIAALTDIPPNIREIYKTVWEIKQSELMRRAAKRGAFIDQSQSLNLYVNSNSPVYLQQAFTTGWHLGLPTGAYYVRSSAGATAMKNNIEPARDAAASPAANSVTNPSSERTPCPPECDSCSA